MTDVQWLLLLLSLLIIVPVIWLVTMGLLRKRDFKRQIEGKRPERKAKENMKISRENPEVNVNMDTERRIKILRGRQPVFIRRPAVFLSALETGHASESASAYVSRPENARIYSIPKTRDCSTQPRVLILEMLNLDNCR